MFVDELILDSKSSLTHIRIDNSFISIQQYDYDELEIKFYTRTSLGYLNL